MTRRQDEGGQGIVEFALVLPFSFKGGGVTSNSSGGISGSGITIFNTLDSYPSAGGGCGPIAITSSGPFNISAPTSGV